jgi:hypothetical protein
VELSGTVSINLVVKGSKKAEKGTEAPYQIHLSKEDDVDWEQHRNGDDDDNDDDDDEEEFEVVAGDRNLA